MSVWVRGERRGREWRKCAFRLNLNPPSIMLSRIATSDGDIRGCPPQSVGKNNNSISNIWAHSIFLKVSIVCGYDRSPR